jgi:hypothetical protein
VGETPSLSLLCSDSCSLTMCGENGVYDESLLLEFIEGRSQRGFTELGYKDLQR